MKQTSFAPSLSWLFICIPAAAVVAYGFPEQQTLLFVLSALAILPLAGVLGEATEHLADHTGEGIGGLLNATFGNATELIVAIFALRQNLLRVVQVRVWGVRPVHNVTIVWPLLRVLLAGCKAVEVVEAVTGGVHALTPPRVFFWLAWPAAGVTARLGAVQPPACAGLRVFLRRDQVQDTGVQQGVVVHQLWPASHLRHGPAVHRSFGGM